MSTYYIEIIFFIVEYIVYDTKQVMSNFVCLSGIRNTYVLYVLDQDEVLGQMQVQLQMKISNLKERILWPT
jgi:hypothetical protein